MFKIVTLNLLLILGLLEFFSLIGVYTNFFTNPSIPTYGGIFSEIDWRTEKEIWGVWHKKNSKSKSVKSCFNVQYSSNDIGARDENNYNAEANNTSIKENIVLIGDSFAEGFGVELKKSFSKVIEQKSNKRVLNFGTSGDFGPLQGYLLYKELASKYSHNEVIIFFLPANDFTDNSFKYQAELFGDRYRPYFKINEKKKFEIYYPLASSPSENFPSIQYSTSTKLKMLMIDFFYMANIYRQIKNIEKSRSTGIREVLEEGYGYNFNDSESIQGTIFYLDKLFKLLPTEYNKTLIIIPTKPDLEMILREGFIYKNLQWYSELRQVALINDIKFLDLALDNEKNSISRLESGIKNWYLKCDPHWGPSGHADAALNYLKLGL